MLEPSVALLYPDIIRAGSLSVVLDEALVAAGSTLRSYPPSTRVDALVLSGTRWASVSIGAVERQFHIAITENQGEQAGMASGWTPELSDVAAAIRSVLENDDEQVSDLVRGFPFLELKPFALGWERGTYIEDHWQSFLLEEVPFYAEKFASGDAPFHRNQLAELITLAAERPELRRLMPYTSLNRFSVRSRLPDVEVSVIWPLGNGRYALIGEESGERFAEGDVSVVLDALVDRVTERDP